MQGELPIPRGGWGRVILVVGAVTLLWSIIAYLVVAFAIPSMDPECYSDIGSRVCPLDKDRDPNLTHLYDSRWPAMDGMWLMLALLTTAALAVCIDRFFVRYWEPWPYLASSGVNVGVVSGTIGVGIGLSVGGAGFTDIRMLLVVTVAGILAIALGGLGMRSLVGDIAQRETDGTKHAL